MEHYNGNKYEILILMKDKDYDTEAIGYGFENGFFILHEENGAVRYFSLNVTEEIHINLLPPDDDEDDDNE